MTGAGVEQMTFVEVYVASNKLAGQSFMANQAAEVMRDIDSITAGCDEHAAIAYVSMWLMARLGVKPTSAGFGVPQ